MGDDDDLLESLEDFEAFARTVGALVNKAPTTDVIQLALREPEESAVYKQARLMAEQRPERLFLAWSNRRKVRGEHSATILHHGIVESARFLVDMTKILTSNGDGQIKVWDVHSGEVLHRFPGHKMRVSSLQLSPDGDYFASGSEDGAVKIWDLGSFMSNDTFLLEEQREVLREFHHREKETLHLHTNLFSHCIGKASVRGRGGNGLSSGSFRGTPADRFRQTVASLMTADNEVRDLSNQSFLFNELHPEAVLHVDFSPEGDEVVACGVSGDVRVFNLRARGMRLRLTHHKEAANVARFSHDGLVICTGSDDASVRLFHSENGAFLGSSNRHQLRVLDVAFVPESGKVSKEVGAFLSPPSQISPGEMDGWNGKGVRESDGPIPVLKDVPFSISGHLDVRGHAHHVGVSRLLLALHGGAGVQAHAPGGLQLHGAQRQRAKVGRRPLRPHRPRLGRGLGGGALLPARTRRVSKIIFLFSAG